MASCKYSDMTFIGCAVFLRTGLRRPQNIKCTSVHTDGLGKVKKNKEIFHIFFRFFFDGDFHGWL